MTPAGYAILVFPTPGGSQRRPAMAVWRTPDGVAWVEPNYLLGYPGDPPSFHRLVCGVKDISRGLLLGLPEGQGLVLARELVLGDDEMDLPELQPVFAAYERALLTRGLTREGEAEQLAELLANDLA